MGLDMYLRGEKFLWTNWQEPEKNLKLDGFQVTEIILDLGYWRKHPNLHGYIVQTFAEGVDECQKIELSEDDIGQIIAAIQTDALPGTEGFFFGKSYTQEDKEEYEKQKADDVAIFERARAWLKGGDKEPELVPVGDTEVKGIELHSIKFPDKMPQESRSIWYRASW